MVEQLGGLVETLARTPGDVLCVTGRSSLQRTGAWQRIRSHLEVGGHTVRHETISGEPSPDGIDALCVRHRGDGVCLVVGIGGGSVVDAGKAISAMLPHDRSVFDHLEGVGRGIPHSGLKVPYVAIPTTSGTGSEVTKNAVLSQVGAGGYKKSLRHDALVPDAVIIDGDLLVSCPPDVSAACGMDAFTQLLEPWLSPTVSPISEALAWSGMLAIRGNLLDACGPRSQDPATREQVAYGAMLSGVALANDGLGIVHGLAGPIGGFFEIPHGVVCANLLPASIHANLRALRERTPDAPVLEKLSQLGGVFGAPQGASRSARCDHLAASMDDWVSRLEIPRLGAFGITEADLDRIAASGKNRNNPIALSRDEIRALVASRL